MNFEEKKYSLNIINNFNKIFTNIILKSNTFKNFLKINYCNNEHLILSKKIKKIFNNQEIILFSQFLKNDKNNPDKISKYYIKLTHLFASVFNITSKNLKIFNNKLHIHFDCYLIPEIDYIYKSEYDISLNEYVLDEDDIALYHKNINEFLHIFNENEKCSTFSKININQVTDKNLYPNKIIFDSDFNNYTYNIVLLIQKIKNVQEKLISILNNTFIFDDEMYITNIISMQELDNIIENVRDILIQYFNEIEIIYNKTLEFLTLHILNTFSKTVKKRIALY